MRIAVYGGSFDPPHVGHAMVSAWLRWTDRVDEVWLVPTYAHAFGKELSPFSTRVRLCEALAADLGPGVRVCTIEAELPAPSYTIATLQALAAAHPEHRLRLVVGGDVLGQVQGWRRWDLIEAHFEPIVVGRAGYPPVPGAVLFPEVSSTEIRARLEAGRPVDHLLTRGVLAALQP